jgi:NAD(P)-dependent dehydrogenase (short-subunit alcohol dehydrogenase family)
MRLQGKTALITGGNSGIGLATARLFVAEGARVAITGRDKTTLDAALKQLGGEQLAFQADVLDAKAREKVFATVENEFVTSTSSLPMRESEQLHLSSRHRKSFLTKFCG